MLDLSLARTPTSFEGHPRSSPRTPSSPSHPGISKGLGDLRSISRKPWSKSADDLGKLTPSSAPTLSPLDTSFRDRVDYYRGRGEYSASTSNSAAPSPTISPDTSSVKNYPFPIITTQEALSSSPPQRGAPISSSSSPVYMTPSPLTSSTSGSTSHVHSRSHSFTPRLPSKLTGPKAGGLIPPSPKRKGSASSDREPDRSIKEKDREKNISTGSGASIGRSAFPFNLGGSSSSSHKGQSSLGSANEDASLSSLSSAVPPLPPTIIEPPNAEADNRAGKRASQVIYHSGFINRFVDFSPEVLNARATHAYLNGGGGSALSRGWKPFKLVLKGSKLYFYKPPNDRSAAIKELFPTELIAVLEEEGLTDVEQDPVEAEEDGRSTIGREREDARRKRAYWGRSTHPGLHLVDGKIEKGSFEALVHEAVFSTTFMTSTELPPNERKNSSSEEFPIGLRYRAEWRDFSAAILLVVPSLTDREKFENELMRCCSYLVNGAEEAVRAEERTRMQWLVNQYLNYYGEPTQKDAWEEWRKEVIPQSSESGTDSATEVQDLLTEDSNAGSSVPDIVQMVDAKPSPNVGAFSPRPSDGSKLQSFAEALGEPPDAYSSRVPPTLLRAAMDNDSLSRDLLFNLDIQLIARSLFALHEKLLRLLPDNLLVDSCLGSLDPASGGSTSSVPQATSSAMHLSPFVGSDEHPHWLTKLILVQVLVPEPPGPPSIEDRSLPSSRTHSRSDIISLWAQIGELCRHIGDACSWRAIEAALCSRPVARLDKVWKRVHPDALSIVQSWVSLCAPDSETEQKGIPWAGDIHAQIQSAFQKLRTDDSGAWAFDTLVEIRKRFESLRTTFSSFPNLSQPNIPKSDDIQALVDYWQHLRSSGSSGSIASKFMRSVNLFMWPVYILTIPTASINLCLYH